jgi:hypothetical protein
VSVAIVAGALANKPGTGGEAWVRLSWVLGLQRLGWEVHLVERLGSDDPAARRYFEGVVGAFGLEGWASLLDSRGAALVGSDEGEMLEVAGAADVVFDISGHLGPGPLLAAPRRRAYIDLDPGFTQAWHTDPEVDFSVAGYDRYFTVGQNIGRSGCPVPTGGIEWVSTLPPILLEEWPPAPAPAQSLTFTTVATWRSPYGTLTIDGREMSLKHHQFRRFAELPERVGGVELELALGIHPGDAADLELLREHGWKLVDPREAAATPQAFRDYVRRSGAEFSVAQGVYVEAATGWFSDRTAAYLASGRPAVVQDTGTEALFETRGAEKRLGVVPFDDLDAAVAGIETVRDHYEEHAGAGRDFAEQHLDSDRVLTRVLEIALALLILVLLPLVGGGAARASASPRVRVVGKPQVVFDWSRQACSREEEPDLPARALRDASGRVHLFLSHYETYRMSGPNLGRVRPRCRAVMASPEDPDPRHFRDRRWIASPFTFDGRHVWALVHQEYQGNRHPGRCPEGAYFPCWYNAITLARSSDGGRTFRQGQAPRQLVAASSRRYRHGRGPTGVFAPSNLVRRGRHLYALVRVREPGQPSGDCLIRTGDIATAGSWRAWDGSSFNVAFEDPYRERSSPPSRCRRIAPDEISEMTESLTFSNALDRYILVGIAGPRTRSAHERGIYFSFSEDLIHWSPRRLILPVDTLHTYRCGDTGPIAYPSLIDPGSSSLNFETTGRRPFLYFTKFRYRGCRKTPDRDLMRVRVSIRRGMR